MPCGNVCILVNTTMHKCSSRWTQTPGRLASTVSHLASPCSSTCQTRSSRSCKVINLIRLGKRGRGGRPRGGLVKDQTFYGFFLGNVPLNPGCFFLSDWPISQQIHGWDDAGIANGAFPSILYFWFYPTLTQLDF